MSFNTMIRGVCILVACVTACASVISAQAAKGSGTGLGQDSVVVDDRTEQIIRGALRYLASKQNGNGSWASGEGERQELVSRHHRPLVECARIGRPAHPGVKPRYVPRMEIPV